MSNTRYKVGETTYDIPENKVDSFLQAKPNAVLVNEGKQNAPQTPDATVEPNDMASNLEDGFGDGTFSIDENTNVTFQSSDLSKPPQKVSWQELPKVAKDQFLSEIKELDVSESTVRQNMRRFMPNDTQLKGINLDIEAAFDNYFEIANEPLPEKTQEEV